MEKKLVSAPKKTEVWEWEEINFKPVKNTGNWKASTPWILLLVGVIEVAFHLLSSSVQSLSGSPTERLPAWKQIVKFQYCLGSQWQIAIV